MRTQTERVASLHTRMEARKRIRERRKTGALAAAASVMTLCLFLAIYGGSTAHPGGTAGLYSGATMLFENAGAFVLVALLAFMAGAAIAAACIRKQRKERKEEQTDETEEM